MTEPFTALPEQPPRRSDDTLYRYPSANARFKAGAEADPYDTVAPGLYPDETAYELDTGEKVAVSVETYWQENGEGVSFIGFARCIDEDGSSKVTSDGKQVETAYSYVAPAVMVNQYGVNAIATDVALMLLGQDTRLTENLQARVDDEEGHGYVEGDQAPEGTVIMVHSTSSYSVETTETVPLIRLDEMTKANINIRHHLNLVEQTNSFPTLDL